MNKWKAFIMAVIWLLSFVISGCGDGDLKKPLSMPMDAAVRPEPLPEQIIVDVYWDATVSMQGFTKLAAGNIYRNLPDALGDWGGTLGKSIGKVHFFRFGEQITPIEGREYRRFSNSDYYTEVVTSFGSVLDVADPQHLSVVVTDLFESDADWSNVTQKLKEKYFSQHMTVAIIGVKNSFSGEIFDVGLNAATFSYDSGDDLGRFRPFYLFLMGTETQVRAFLEKWMEKESKNGEMEYVVFSEHFTEDVLNFQLSKAKDKQNLFEDRQLPKADDRLQEVGFADKNNRVQITLPGKCQLLPYGCLKAENISNLDSRVTIYSLNSDDVWEKYDGSKKPDVVFESTSNADGEGNNCELKLGFHADSVMPRGRIGLMQVQILPSRQNLELPEWLTAWDMGDIDANPELFDGSKTVNLGKIGASLKDTLLTAAQPTLAEFYLVVDGR